LPISDKPRRHGVRAAFGYAFAGLSTAWRSERNLRIHAAIALVVVIAGMMLRLRPLAWGLLVFAIGLVLVTELLNSAIEAVVDLVSPHDDPLAKRAKDVGAAAVLVAAVTAATIGVLIAVSSLGSP
jgi:undecaprenol kinase